MTQNHALLDWISFTLPAEYAADSGKKHLPDIGPVVWELFGRDIALFDHTAKKANFYRHRYTLKGRSGNPLVHIFTEPDAAQNAKTTLFMLTGYALSSKPDALTDLDPQHLLMKVKERGGRLTRIDLALDDFSGRPILAHMIEACQPDIWRDRTITTLCRVGKPVAIWDETLYIGNRAKGSCICAYNKAKQQGVDFNWFRCEFSTRDRDLCAAILDDITAGVPIGKLTAGLIGQYLRFVPPGRKAKGNRPPCSWWTDLLAEGAGYELARQRGGKVDDEPRKTTSADSVLRYLKDAHRHGNTGEVLTAIQDFLTDLQLAAAWN